MTMGALIILDKPASPAPRVATASPSIGSPPFRPHQRRTPPPVLMLLLSAPEPSSAPTTQIPEPEADGGQPPRWHGPTTTTPSVPVRASIMVGCKLAKC